jgi:hypothetical protein
MRAWVILIVFVSIGHAGTCGLSDTLTLNCYENAYSKLNNLITKNGSFKGSVFIVENAYFNNQLDQEKFDKNITTLKNLCLNWSRFNVIRDYKYNDSINFQNNFSLYAVMKDTIKMIDTASNKYYHLPFTYDFNDFSGKDN